MKTAARIADFLDAVGRARVLALFVLALAAWVAWAVGILPGPFASALFLGAVGISFNSVPSNLRVNFFAAEFDNTQASQGPALLSYRVLLVGQKTSAGTGTANQLYRVTSAAAVLTLAGRGSMLHRMALRYFANNTTTETWILILADNGAGTAATGTITVSGPSTAAGTLHLYLGGVYVPVTVASGDSANTIATAVGDAINDNLDLPVTATVLNAVVTWTFRHKGAVGNSYDVRANYQFGEAYPAGVSVAIVAASGGATNPTLTTGIAALGDNWYHVWAHPYTDSTSLAAIETELTRRFGPMTMIDGLAITSAAGSYSTLSTLGAARNSPHSKIVAQPGENPLTPPMEFAAAVAGVVALSGANDPALPLHTLAVTGALAPAESDLFTIEEKNLLLFDGISVSDVSAGGTVSLNTQITTYQTNGAGADDTSYLLSTTMLTLMYLRYSFRTRVRTRFARAKIANDGAVLGSGQVVLTPSVGRAEAVAWFKEMQQRGLVEDLDQFEQDLVVERDQSNPNQMNWLLPPTLMGPFIVGAAKIQFRV